MNLRFQSVGLVTTLVFIGVGGAAIVNAAEVPSQETQLENRFQSLDQNANGVIDNREAKADARLNGAFDRIATKTLDKPGFLAWSKAYSRQASERDLGN